MKHTVQEKTGQSIYFSYAQYASSEVLIYERKNP